MAKQKRIAFLLGAGASKAVGMPDTMDITKEILSKSRLKATKWIQNKVVLNVETPVEVRYGNEILEFLNRLLEFAGKNNPLTIDPQNEEPLHMVNYEDLFYMIEQLFRHSIEEYNLLGHLLYDQLFNEAQKDKYESANGKILFGEFINSTAGYLTMALKNLIKERQSAADIKLAKLKLITGALNDKAFKMTNIFTLNHDTILEKLLRENNIMFCDGFEQTDAEIRKWNPELFGSLKNKQEGAVNLYKLHGSIDWQYYYHSIKTAEGIPITEIYARNSNTKIENKSVKNSKGEECHLHSDILLVGTKNKIDSYLIINYWELFYRFRRALRQVDVVIVCGYSFGDSGINGQLLEWVLNLDNKKMIIVNTGDRVSFINRLGHRLQKYFEEYKAKILYKEARIEDLDWGTLQKEFLE